jgi:SAM-dependent methyltransferase
MTESPVTTNPTTAVPAFDLIAERYDEAFTDRNAQLAAGRWLIDELPSGARVLDLGCGSGLPTAVQLADAGLQVVGTDESGRMLELASGRVPGATFLQRDIRDLGEDLGTFDAVVSFFSLLMLPRTDISRVLVALRERLTERGLLAIGMVYGDMDYLPICFLGASTFATCYPTDQLVRVVSEAGFEVIEVDEVDVQAEPERVERQIFLRARVRSNG